MQWLRRTRSFGLAVGVFVAALPGLLSNSVRADDARDAITRVKSALRSGDVARLGRGLEQLIDVGGKKSMKSLLSVATKIPDGSDGYYWPLLEAAASFTDRAGLGELGSYIARNKDRAIARDLLHALQASLSSNVVHALRPILDKGSGPVRLKAVSKIVTIRTQESIDALIGVLQAEEKKSKDEPTQILITAARGLEQITGQRLGRSVLNWVGWWEKHRGTTLHVKPLDPEGEGRATGTAVDTLDDYRKEAFIGLEKAPKKGVVVLSALYTKKLQRDLNNDHMEHVLSRMGVPHTIVRRENFAGFDLSQTGAILINCAQFHRFCICPTCKPGGGVNNRLRRCTGCNKHINFSAELTAVDVEKLQRFVMRGGYLFSEDWVVKEVIERAFPKFVVAGDRIDECAVDVFPVRGRATHPYLTGVFTPKPLDDHHDDDIDLDLDLDLDLDDDDFGDDDDDDDDDDSSRGRTIVVPAKEKDRDRDAELVKIRHRWQIDRESFALVVKNRARVLQLLAAPKVVGLDGEAVSPIVALAFRPGSGKAARTQIGDRRRGAEVPGVVVQVLSHFGKQNSLGDERSLENLLLNFLIDANVAREARSVERQGRQRG